MMTLRQDIRGSDCGLFSLKVCRVVCGKNIALILHRMFSTLMVFSSSYTLFCVVFQHNVTDPAFLYNKQYATACIYT